MALDTVGIRHVAIAAYFDSRDGCLLYASAHTHDADTVAISVMDETTFVNDRPVSSLAALKSGIERVLLRLFGSEQ